ncbi:MAG: alpha/beta fold hydrolase [Gammaproteobacteria bacterium]|nr:alpha/beta fold hydrolase [Gammaproteobacteria bacterium]
MMFPDYPFDSHFATVKDLRIHYLDEGAKTAAPVIMLHGNPSWSYYYRHLVSVLSKTSRCVVPDHIGMGMSDKPAAADYNFDLDRRVDDLEALLDKLRIEDNITLVLHDWGGMIGMSYAQRYPQRIKRLVILNTAAFHLPATKNLPWQLILSRLPFLNAILNQGFNAFCKGAVKYCVTRTKMEPDVAMAYLHPYDSWHNRLAVRKFVEAIPLKVGDEGYATVDAVDKNLQQFSDLPMLICWGLKDFVFDEHFLQEWLRRFPEAESHRFEDAGHYILEDAKEELLPLIENFLSRHPLAEAE